MNTYQKQYKIKWLNFNPAEKRIEALYEVNALLDDGNTLKMKDFHALVDGDKYEKLFNLNITTLGINTTLGEFITYLAATAANLKEQYFPISTETIDKFGTQGSTLLQ